MGKEEFPLNSGHQRGTGRDQHMVSPHDEQFGGDHYKKLSVQPWDVVDQWHLRERVGFYRGNCLKYAMRMGSKGASLEDAEKLAHYARKLVAVLKEVSDA